VRVITGLVGLAGGALLFLPWWSGPAPVRLDPGALEMAPLTGLDALGAAGYAVLAAAGIALLLNLADLVRPSGSGAHPGAEVPPEPTSAEGTTVPELSRVSPPGSAWSRPALGRSGLALVGAALLAAACATVVLLGPSPALGPWVAALLGTVAVVLGLRRDPRRVPAVAALLGVVAVLVAVPRPTPVAVGPYVQLADLGRDAPRSGVTTLADRGGPLRALAVGGDPGIGSWDGITVVREGRTRVLAVADGGRGTPQPAVLGATDRTVLTWSDVTTLTATDLDTGARTALSDVAAASRPGPDGTVLVRRVGESAVHRWRPGGALAPTPFTGDPTSAVPVPGGVLAVEPGLGGDRLVRVTDAGTEVLAGGADPGCGLTADPRTAHLPAVRAVTPVGTDLWFLSRAVDDRALLRLDAAGTLTRYATPPGHVEDIAPAAAGLALVLTPAGSGLRTGLWLLPWSAPAEALQATPADCVPDPAPAAPPVGLVPVADTGGDRLGVPLDDRGTWAAQDADGVIAAVGADGTRTPLGTRQDRHRGYVWPDGAGGAWWLEARRGADSTLELVHGTPGGSQRFGLVTDPAPRTGSLLVPDLSGAPPLLGTADGLYRLDGGAPVRVAEGAYSGGVVAPDGRAWFVRDGIVVDRDGRTVLGAPGGDPVDDPGGAPARVQLARGTAPADLRLQDPDLAVDAAGRLLVADGGVLLAVDPAGTVTVVADDPRLLDLPLWTVRDGFATVTGTAVTRVALPT
jgi:hypothetical protein